MSFTVCNASLWKVSSLVVEGTSQSQIITGLEMRSRELVGVLVTAEKVAQPHTSVHAADTNGVLQAHMYTHYLLKYLSIL